MEQQQPYPWEDQEQQEENDEASQLQGRQSRHRNNTIVPIVVSTYCGHQEEVEEARDNSNHEELYKIAAGFAEEDKEGTISDKPNHIGEEEDIQTSLTTEVRVSSQNVKILEPNETISATDVESCEEVSYQNGKILEDDESISSIQVASREEETTISSKVPLHNTNGSNVDAHIIEEIDDELTDFDVEEVIKKQDTHDLYCPKCKICITRTVILVRRKKPKFVGPIAGRNKTKPIKRPKAQTLSNVPPNTEPRNDKTETEEDVYFRCLSCFSFFIPRVNFGKNDENGKEEAAGNESAGAKAYWPWSIFIPVTTDNRVSNPSDHIEENNEGNKQPVGDFHVNPPQGDQGGVESVAPAQHSGQILPSVFFDGSTPEDNIIPSKQKQEDAMVGNITGNNVAAGHSDIEAKISGDRKPFNDDIHVKPSPGVVGVQSPNQYQSPMSELRERQKGEGIAPTSPTISEAPRKNTEVSPDDGLVGKKNGGDVILQVASDPEPESPTGVETREVQGWDILKSIVYGGLVESIASLGVVSSAAGSGATTLSIFAMGLANLIAGLLVLGHNLRELKKEQYGAIPNQLNEQEGRYQKLLGRKGNFPLHASLAVISFLFFGLLPPVIYGFSFRESDNKDLKLAVVLGVSLICIILLVIAKCYVNKSPPKSYIKTLLYYLSTGVVASCVSYLAGELIDKLMEKLGWFDSTSTVALSFIEASKHMESAWASY